MRPAHRVLIVLTLAVGSFGLTFVDAARLRAGNETARADMRRLVERLGLTDPVLFTEARYTRHPTQADLQSAFQDHPVALEHFPTGSLMPPPAGILKAYENLDRKTAAPD
jgi:ABC-type dipeptide/oligopeptide/nickel transport system permease component